MVELSPIVEKVEGRRATRGEVHKRGESGDKLRLVLKWEQQDIYKSLLTSSQSRYDSQPAISIFIKVLLFIS